MSSDERRRDSRRSIVSTCLALLVGFGAMVCITVGAPLAAAAYPPTTPGPTTSTTVDIGGPTTTTIQQTTTTVQIGGPTTTSIPSTTVVRPTTTIVQIGGPTTTRPGDIPQMGANSIDLVQIGVVAVVAGLILLGVVALRRRPAVS
jgi:hypothetical protein